MDQHGEIRPARARLTETMIGNDHPTLVGRRSFLRGALLSAAGLVVGTQMSGCSPSSSRLMGARTAQASVVPARESKVLLAYFSRAGENYYYGGRTQLTVGNTEVLANKIVQLVGCDVYRIEPADPYPEDYEETRDRNIREQRADARPAIANPLDSIESYDTVLLGSPIWSVRTPMIMTTFAESFNFSGKTVIPFVTYAVSGLGTTVRDYAASCPGATIGKGLAVQGEEVGDANPSVDAAVDSWLRRIGLRDSRSATTGMGTTRS